MPSASRGWSGGYVAQARKHWAAVILRMATEGNPIQCSFAGRDPRCPGAVLPTHTWHVDHVVPRSQGGAVLDPNNQRPAHAACNSRAGAAMTNAKRASDAKGLWSW